MEEEIIIVVKPKSVEVTQGGRKFRVESEYEISPELASSYAQTGVGSVFRIKD